MKTCHWGRKYWTVLYHILLEYLNNTPYGHNVEAYHISLLFDELKNVLPCKNCKKHYMQNLQKLPIEPFLVNRKSMIVWLNKLHNNVCDILNKPILTEEEFHQKYYKPLICNSFNSSIKEKGHSNCNCDQVRKGFPSKSSMEDYTINDAIWTVLFSIALTYPERPHAEQEFHYRLFITELLYLLPESKLKKQIWQAYYHSPDSLDEAIRNGRAGLYSFMFNLHNTVMRMQNCKRKYTDKLILEKYLCKM